MWRRVSRRVPSTRYPKKGRRVRSHRRAKPVGNRRPRRSAISRGRAGMQGRTPAHKGYSARIRWKRTLSISRSETTLASVRWLPGATKAAAFVHPSTAGTAQTSAQLAGGADSALPPDVRSTERFFNANAFVLQPSGSFGNLGRNNLIGPGLSTLDASVIKNFRITEGPTIQLRFEAFNPANHPNWGLPGATISGADFGKICQTRTAMRELQIAAKYVF